MATWAIFGLNFQRTHTPGLVGDLRCSCFIQERAEMLGAIRSALIQLSKLGWPKKKIVQPVVGAQLKTLKECLRLRWSSRTHHTPKPSDWNVFLLLYFRVLRLLSLCEPVRRTISDTESALRFLRLFIVNSSASLVFSISKHRDEAEYATFLAVTLFICLSTLTLWEVRRKRS